MVLVVMGVGQPRLDIRQMGRSHLSPFSLHHNTPKKKKKSKVYTLPYDPRSFFHVSPTAAVFLMRLGVICPRLAAVLAPFMDLRLIRLAPPSGALRTG